VIVVDTSALMAILNKEAERDRFLDILANDDKPLISAVTFYETMLIVAVRRGLGNLDDLSDLIEAAEARLRGSIRVTASPTPWPSISMCLCCSKGTISPQPMSERRPDCSQEPGFPKATIWGLQRFLC
jgi:hypothetical protein